MAPYNGTTDITGLMEAIEQEEVENAISDMNAKSAAGLDGMKVEQIENIMGQDVTLIPRLFSLWQKLAFVPTALKRSRTVLIPKTEDAELLQNIDNWRPITIGPMLLRLFTKIIAKRLSEAVTLNPRQKGFIAATPGCNENIAILENIMKGAKSNKKELAVVFVDLAKAFDSIGHKMLTVGLKRMGIPNRFIHLVQSLYTGNTTVIEGDKTATEPIPIKRGVKQGDPLSPLLFNITMDPLICSLEQAQMGVTLTHNNRRISCSSLAFADDIAILSDSYAGMTANMKILQSFCQNTGLQINIKKTAGFHCKPYRKTFLYNTQEKWKINGEPVNHIQPGELEKYLGARIDPWAGVTEDNWSVKLNTWISSLKETDLKPTQRLEILKTHMIPRIYYHLILTEASQNTVVKLDNIIKKAVKEILHLPADTTDGILYSKNKDGGLGIPKLEVQIPSAIIRKLESLERSQDAVISASFQFRGSNNVEHINKLRNLKVLREIEEFLQPAQPNNNEEAGLSTILEMEESLLETEGTAKPINKYAEWRKWEFEKWTKLLAQGPGIHYYQNDPTSNAWLYGHHKMKQSLFIKRLLLRCNLYPTRCTISYGRPNMAKLCRRCAMANETLAHISGQCLAVKNARIKRHNKILDKLKVQVAKHGWTVHIEPRFRTADGRLWKPDLIFVKEQEVAVVDVTVRYESNNMELERAWKEKTEKYEHLRGQIAEVTKGTSIKFFGFVMGARGKWHDWNDTLMAYLKIEKYKSFSKNLSDLTIALTLDILRIFNDQ